MLFLLCFSKSPAQSKFPLEPHLLDEEAYSETYTLFFTTENDRHLIIQLSVSNLGLGDQNAMCRILFLDQAGSWAANSFYDQELWSFNPPADLLVGTCSISVKEKALVISAELNQRKFDAVLHSEIHVTYPPNHLIKTANGFFDQQVLIRWGKADVILRMPEGLQLETQAFGFMYRFWVTALPPDLAHRWIRVYGLDADGSTLIMGRYPPGEALAEGWAWFSKSTAPGPIDSMVLQKSAGKHTLITGMTGGVQYQLILQKTLHRYAPIEDMGFWGRLVRPWIGNPVTYAYKALLKTGDSNLVKTAIVEITENEVD